VAGGPVLETSGLVRRFGGVVAVNHVSLSIEPGELHGVIGPNGAGKSTLFHLITGQLRPSAGTVTYEGRRIEGLPAHRRCQLGVGIAFQTVRLFPDMTVRENVMVGAQPWTRTGFWEAALRLPRHRREEKLIREAADAAVARVGLGAYTERHAGSLPLGLQRAVQVARALCGRPHLLLLDEPASGLRAAERAHLAALLKQLRQAGLTMLLVEHDVAFVTGLADRMTVLDRGEIIATGTPVEIRRDPTVIAAYLGQEKASA
jgi:branched-chain amino acid transport system ATP-binding protein